MVSNWNRYRKTCQLDQRRYRLRSRFNMTIEDYDNLYKLQDGRCKICGKRETKLVKNRTTNVRRLSVDHDHKTHKVRGLLCTKCNLILGLCKDDKDYLSKIILYLQ